MSDMPKGTGSPEYDNAKPLIIQEYERLKEENERLLEWKARAIERARDEVLAEQASEPTGCVYDGEHIAVFEGPHGEAWAVQDKHGVWWAHSKQMSAEQATWKFTGVSDAVNAAKKLAGIEPEGPGPVPDWFAEGCKKAGYGIPVEQHWAGYIGDLCREALRQAEGGDDDE